MKCVKCGHDPVQPVRARYEFVIDRDPPSLNQRIYNSGSRAYLYRKERKTWGWEIRAARLRVRIPVAHWQGQNERRRVTLTRLFSGQQKTRDVDNLAGGMKAIVDALALDGLIADDSPTWTELHYAQERVAAGKPTGLHIVIEALGSAASDAASSSLPPALFDRAIESALDAALGEVARQAGVDPQILREARSDGWLASRPFAAGAAS